MGVRYEQGEQGKEATTKSRRVHRQREREDRRRCASRDESIAGERKGSGGSTIGNGMGKARSSCSPKSFTRTESN